MMKIILGRHGMLSYPERGFDFNQGTAALRSEWVGIYQRVVVAAGDGIGDGIVGAGRVGMTAVAEQVF
jgi:hypothetical protein